MLRTFLDGYLWRESSLCIESEQKRVLTLGGSKFLYLDGG